MGKKLVRTTTALSVLAFLLQAASIAAPGWLIYIHGNFVERDSLFYRWRCATLLDEEKCELKSFHDLHFDERQQLVEAQVSRRKLASVDYHYSTIVCQQVLTVVAAVLSLVVVISQLYQNVKKDSRNIRAILLSATASATSAGIAIAVVSNEITYIWFQKELKDFDGLQDHTYIAFPYCLVLLGGSALFHFCTNWTLGSQLYKPKPKVLQRKYYAEDSSRDSNGDVSGNVTTDTKLNTYEKPNKENEKLSTMKDFGHDNHVFSEKL